MLFGQKVPSVTLIILSFIKVFYSVYEDHYNFILLVLNIKKNTYVRLIIVCQKMLNRKNLLQF